MRRREFIGIVGGAAAALPLAAWSQPAGATKRQIGYVGSGRQSGLQAPYDCFIAGLRERGWADGININLIYRVTDSTAESLANVAHELVSLGPDIIVTASTPSTLAIKNATERIPVVFVSVSDPVATGIVKSLARPDGNLTGVSNFLPATTAKLLELLQTVALNSSRVGVLFDPTNAGKLLEVRELATAASALRIELVLMEVRSATDIDQILSGQVGERCNSLITLVDSVTFPNRSRIAELASHRGLPAIYQVRDFVDAGGLISYGLNYCRHFHRAASYVDRILKGARPADLPIELPTEFELAINLKAAKGLGINIPPTLLARADQVIE